MEKETKLEPTYKDVCPLLDEQEIKDVQEYVTLTSAKVECLANHKETREILLLGITPGDLQDEIAGNTFDLEKLKDLFAEFCYDYNDNLEAGKRSRALQFMYEVIYRIGPESRTVKAGTKDHSWIFTAPVPVTRQSRVKTILESSANIEMAKQTMLMKRNTIRGNLAWNKDDKPVYDRSVIALAGINEEIEGLGKSDEDGKLFVTK